MNMDDMARNHCQNSQQIAYRRLLQSRNGSVGHQLADCHTVRYLCGVGIHIRILRKRNWSIDSTNARWFNNLSHGENIDCGTAGRDSKNELGTRASAFEAPKCDSHRLVAGNRCFSPQGLSQQALMET